MALSERESRMLQEMESHLLAEDPRLATTLGSRRLPLGLGAVLAVSGLLAGVLLMAVGVGQGEGLGTAIALVGFLFLLTGTSVIGEWVRAREKTRTLTSSAGNQARRAT